jgi:hypothetical protein
LKSFIAHDQARVVTYEKILDFAFLLNSKANIYFLQGTPYADAPTSMIHHLSLRELNSTLNIKQLSRFILSLLFLSFLRNPTIVYKKQSFNGSSSIRPARQMNFDNFLPTLFILQLLNIIELRENSSQTYLFPEMTTKIVESRLNKAQN